MGGVKDQRQVLGELSTHLAVGKLMYDGYLTHGKIKSRARLLRHNNQRVSDLLVSNIHRLDDDLKPEALALLHHALCFVAQWDAYDRAHHIEEEQLFAYPTDVPFPGAAVRVLLGE